MLVWNKDPYSVLSIGHYRIYGSCTGFNPVEVPWEFYQQYENTLIDATYREGYLKKIFGRNFHSIAFKYSELHLLPRKIIRQLALNFGIPDMGVNRMVFRIRKKIRDGP